MVNWKKFLYRCISKILFIDTEQFSKMHILSQVFLKDFFDRLGNIYLRNEFLWKILFIYSATSSTRMIHLKVQIHTYIYTRTYVHTYLPTYLPTYIHTYIHTYIQGHYLKRGKINPSANYDVLKYKWTTRYARQKSTEQKTRMIKIYLNEIYVYDKNVSYWIQIYFGWTIICIDNMRERWHNPNIFYWMQSYFD